MPVQAIDFRLGPYHIDGAGFHAVAMAITTYHISVQGKDNIPGREAWGAYADQIDTIGIPTVTQISHPTWLEAVLVHESVNALIDLKGPRGGARSQNEAAAYIATALYLLSFDFPAPKGAILDTALKIADPLKAGMTVDKASEMRLRTVVATNMDIDVDEPSSDDGVRRQPQVTDFLS